LFLPLRYSAVSCFRFVFIPLRFVLFCVTTSAVLRSAAVSGFSAVTCRFTCSALTTCHGSCYRSLPLCVSCVRFTTCLQFLSFCSSFCSISAPLSDSGSTYIPNTLRPFSVFFSLVFVLLSVTFATCTVFSVRSFSFRRFYLFFLRMGAPFLSLVRYRFSTVFLDSFVHI